MFRRLQMRLQLLLRRKALSISAQGGLLTNRTSVIIQADTVTNVIILLGKRKSNITLGGPMKRLLAFLKALS